MVDNVDVSKHETKMADYERDKVNRQTCHKTTTNGCHSAEKNLNIQSNRNSSVTSNESFSWSINLIRDPTKRQPELISTWLDSGYVGDPVWNIYYFIFSNKNLINSFDELIGRRFQFSSLRAHDYRFPFLVIECIWIQLFQRQTNSQNQKPSTILEISNQLHPNSP